MGYPKVSSALPLLTQRARPFLLSHSSAVTFARSRPKRDGYHRCTQPVLAQLQSEGGPYEYKASSWISRRSDGTVRCSARYHCLFADGVLRIARLGEPSHRQSFKRAHADKAHKLDAMTSSGLPDPVALRPTWKGNLIFLLVVAVVVLAVAS